MNFTQKIYFNTNYKIKLYIIYCMYFFKKIISKVYKHNIICVIKIMLLNI
jgi:hypothetical protein